MKLLLTVAILTLIGCGKLNKKEKVIEVQDGVGCTQEQDAKTEVIRITCGDAVTEIKPPKDGRNGQDGVGQRGPAGSSGTPGGSCSVEQTDTGADIVCDDGRTATITNGGSGNGCRAEERPYGADIICGDNPPIAIRNGQPGGGVGRDGSWVCDGNYRPSGRYWWRLRLQVFHFTHGYRSYQFTERRFEGNQDRGVAHVGNWWEDSEVVPIVGPEFDAVLIVPEEEGKENVYRVRWRRYRTGYTWVTDCEVGE